MVRVWPSLILVAALTAGCFGRTAPEESIQGPSAALAVKNLGPHDAQVTITIKLANGTTTKDTFGVKANQTVIKHYRTLSGQPVSVQLVYAWDQDGRASSGDLNLSYDQTGCDGAYGIDVTIETTTGKTGSSSSTTCRA